MQRITATLVAEGGSSGQARVPFIEFVLDAHYSVSRVTTFANEFPQGAPTDRIAQVLPVHPIPVL